jgi:RNA polymerase sigma-70 factor, ECF subfamily
MDDPAFTQLVDAHYAPLYRFALSLARHEADACDLVQETFCRWAQHGHTLRDAARAKAWLFTTLYREFLRGRRRDQRVSALADLPPDEQDVSAAEIDLARRCDARAVLGALQQVDENFRVPLTLFFVEDFSYREIGALLDVPIGTVMSRLARGKEQLRRALRAQAAAADGHDAIVPFPRSEQANGRAS